MLFFAVLVLVIFIIVGATALARAEEQDGLPDGFGKRIIGRKHGDLIEATPIDENDLPRRKFARNALIASGIFLVLPVLINIPTSGSIGQSILFVTGTYSVLLIAILMAIIARPSLGLRRGVLNAVAGGFMAAILPLLIVALLRETVSTEIGNAVLFYAFIIGALCGVYFAPAYRKFSRRFADGFTDTITVSEDSEAHKAFLCLKTDSPLSS